jgi:hypothetical protein
VAAFPTDGFKTAFPANGFKTAAIQGWLARDTRFHLHFTPTGSSWINQVAGSAT